MRKATENDKLLVVTILTRSFDRNQNVNYITKQDSRRTQRIQALMAYSFDMCGLFGEVLISDDDNGCALILYPDKKRLTLTSIFLNIKLILNSLGLKNIVKTLKREKLIRRIQPDIQLSYLWFIGVNPADQGKGIGSQLLQDIINYSHNNGRPVFLETSTVKNLPWYERFGFQLYSEQDLTYHLYFLKNEVN